MHIAILVLILLVTLVATAAGASDSSDRWIPPGSIRARCKSDGFPKLVGEGRRGEIAKCEPGGSEVFSALGFDQATFAFRALTRLAWPAQSPASPVTFDENMQCAGVPCVRDSVRCSTWC